MSLDVTYHSFSPSLADKKWKHFQKDILAIRRGYQKINPNKAKMEAYKKRYIEARQQFAEKEQAEINAKRREIFRRFEKKGFYIPGVDWWENEGVSKSGEKVMWGEESKFEYMRLHWLLPKGFFPPTQEGTPHAQTDQKTIDEFDSFVQSAEDKFNLACGHVKQEFGITDKELQAYEKGPKLTNRQQELNEGGAVHYYLGEARKFDREKLRQNLKLIDIFYGSSVKNEYFENPKMEREVLEAIVRGAKLKYADSDSRNPGNIPLKSEWIRLYKNITPELINIIARDYFFSNWSVAEAQAEILANLKSARPVIKDLKAKADSVFIRQYLDSWDIEPVSSNKLLDERAARHAKQFAGTIPPIL